MLLEEHHESAARVHISRYTVFFDNNDFPPRFGPSVGPDRRVSGRRVPRSGRVYKTPRTSSAMIETIETVPPKVNAAATTRMLLRPSGLVS